MSLLRKLLMGNAKKDIPDNEIWYKAINDASITINNKSFYGKNDSKINVVSHSYRNGLGKIVLDEAIIRIGKFCKYGNVTELILPNSITTISQTCNQWHDLISVKLPSNLKEIEYDSFSACWALTGVTLPDKVTKIYDKAFSYCLSLTEITLPDSVWYLQNYVFRYASFSAITIPDTVEFIGEGCFYYCSGLVDIKWPSNTRYIKDQMFNSCTSLKSITIPDTVHDLGNYTFKDCNNLKNITIPEGVTELGDHLFANCNSLYIGILTIPDSVTTIGNLAFYGVEGDNVKIPSGVTSIGKEAFAATKINDFHLEPLTPPTLGEGAFDYITSTCKIYVPSNSLEAYKIADVWSNYADKIYPEP